LYNLTVSNSIMGIINTKQKHRYDAVETSSDDKHIICDGMPVSVKIFIKYYIDRVKHLVFTKSCELDLNGTERFSKLETIHYISADKYASLTKEKRKQNPAVCEKSKLLDDSFEICEGISKNQQNIVELNYDKINEFDSSDVQIYIKGNCKLFKHTRFNGNISNWDVSGVTDMGEMFYHSKFNGDISNWTVSNVTAMDHMFYYADFNQDISRWDTSSVLDMSGMFKRTYFNQDISNWSVHSVKYMEGMFEESEFLGDISRWDTSSVIYMKKMFSNSLFNGDISTWNTSSVIDMSDMFYYANFNQDISTWDTSTVINTSRMFYGSDFSYDISEWNLSNVLDSRSMLFNSRVNDNIEFDTAESNSVNIYDDFDSVEWSTED